jgi:hypothetical protein
MEKRTVKRIDSVGWRILEVKMRGTQIDAYVQTYMVFSDGSMEEVSRTWTPMLPNGGVQLKFGHKDIRKPIFREGKKPQMRIIRFLSKPEST